MHELSICQGIVDAVVSETAKLNPPAKRVIRVRIVVGKLRQLVPSYMQDAYLLLTKDTLAQGSALDIRVEPVTGLCPLCGWKGELSPSNCTCGACGSDRTEVSGGLELYLENIEVETD